ncbi:MAG TPA: hypothetical protein VEB42_03825 [Chitinophagaceae bacterium]|nr:hypothetical protein [Chitinophagaceae bacterium]
MKNLLPILLLLLCAAGKAQLKNSGNLQVYSGASMTSFGDITNSGTLLNNGTVYLKGNLSNSQLSMSAGSGTLQFNGSSAQAVNGTQQFKTFNLITSNAAGITLNNNLSVSGTHTFSSGVITASANYLVYEAGSSYTGDNDSRHVNGWVKKFGTTNFAFP